jgi:tetratricopeptide (TPR) repeat protein
VSDKKKQIYDLGKNVGAEGLKAFPESVGINAWMAIIWGVWGEENGILQSAKQGVAGKVREHCEKVIALDDHFQDATGYRVLGRVNFKAPKIPIILGWPSKDKAVEYLEKANKIAPTNLYTKQYLAEAYYDKGQKNPAKELLRNVIATSDTVHGVVEDAVIKRNAETLLKQWK